MAQTITRSGKAGGVRRQSRPSGGRDRSRRKGGSNGSLLDPLMHALPLSERQWHGLFTMLILGGAIVLALTAAINAGLLESTRLRIAQASADAGFEVRRVEVRGVERMNELAVYERALSERNQAMTELDLEKLRAELLRLPYVEDARIVRQLPDGLIIDIVERVPHAVLREGGQLYLIDRAGHRLERASREEARGLRVVEGQGAPAVVADLDGLLAAAPSIAGRVVSAQWVGERRWTLTFATGQELALPQGADRAAAAFASFARLDGDNGLLGGQVAAFDMRSPERIYLRVPGRSAAAAAAAEQEGT
jgi:cell division protein FtsQ